MSIIPQPEPKSREDEIPELQAVYREQILNSQEFVDNKSRHPRLAIMGLSDWVAEELLIREELGL